LKSEATAVAGGTAGGVVADQGAHRRERRGDAQAVAEAAHRVELIVRLESEVRANVNLKHALANLVAQWGAVR
jgi:t-SNARE complex subunit (syntaxin)